MADQFLTDLNALSKGTQEVLAANAKSQGITAEEYLASRGGVNPVTRKYGDSYDPNLDLNDAEYMAAVAGKTGLDQGKALNAARAKKVQAYVAANPTSRTAVEYRSSQKSSTATVSEVVEQSDGSSLVTYSDGTSEILPAGTQVPAVGSSLSTGFSTNTTGTTSTTGTMDEDYKDRKSAYDLLLSEFKQYGLEALVTPLKSLIEEGVSPSEFTLRLRETDAYKKRFAANAQRVAKGLRALSEAEYVGTEDQYQDVMRRYGMPESYYTKGELGIQSGFEKFLAGDVSAVELEDRIQTAQNRVVNSNPEVSKALKEFYPGISNGDILAYVLDPTNAIENIKRKVTAAEIGGAAIQSGLQANVARAEELGAAGITKAQAQQGFGTIGGGLQRGSQLASIYGEDAYNQTTAEQEVFGLAGAQEARKQRQKITGLEKATFGGQTGASSSAISRDRAGAY
jgi:hypothetical protein